MGGGQAQKTGNCGRQAGVSGGASMGGGQAWKVMGMGGERARKVTGMGGGRAREIRVKPAAR